MAISVYLLPEGTGRGHVCSLARLESTSRYVQTCQGKCSVTSEIVKIKTLLLNIANQHFFFFSLSLKAQMFLSNSDQITPLVD